MSRTEFDRFVQRQQPESNKEKGADPQQRLQEWKNYLGALYTDIQDYMAPYVADNRAHIKFADIELNEEFIGRYTTKQLLLEIGRSTIKFTPVGTILFGGSGRVDVEGPRGTVRLVVVGKNVTRAHQLIKITLVDADTPKVASSPEVSDKQGEWAWKIMSPAPALTFTELKRDTFFDMILSVADA